MRNQIMYLLFIIVLSSLIGCNTKEGKKSPSPAEKSLFSLWSAQDSSGIIMDFSKFKFGFNGMIYSVSNGQCICDFGLAGDQSSGNFSVTNCEATSGSLSHSECQLGLTQSGTYTKQSSILKMCTLSVLDPDVELPEGGFCRSYK